MLVTLKSIFFPSDAQKAAQAQAQAEMYRTAQNVGVAFAAIGAAYVSYRVMSKD